MEAKKKRCGSRLLAVGLLAGAMLQIPGIGAQGGEPIKVACIGNSITNGGGVYASYPDHLGPMLAEKYGENAYRVDNFGVGGTTLSKLSNNPYWEHEELQQALASEPDFVIIKFGTNDSKASCWPQSKDTYDDDLTEMVHLFQALPSAPVVCVGIPVWVCKDNYNISRATLEQEIMPVIRRTAIELGVDTIDFYSVLKDHPEYYHTDGIHPTHPGAELLAAKVMEKLEEYPHPDPSGVARPQADALMLPTRVQAGSSLDVDLGDGRICRLYDLQGALVLEAVADKAGRVNLHIPSSPGVYVLQLVGGTAPAQCKLVVE